MAVRIIVMDPADEDRVSLAQERGERLKKIDVRCDSTVETITARLQGVTNAAQFAEDLLRARAEKGDWKGLSSVILLK
jgi:hypothetical protein